MGVGVQRKIGKNSKLEKIWVVGLSEGRRQKIIIGSMTFFLTPPATVVEMFDIYLYNMIENAFKLIRLSQMAKNAFKFYTMIGKSFKIRLSQMAKNAFKLSSMVGENVEIHSSQMNKNALKLCTMVGENFELHLFQMGKNAFKLSTMDG